MLLVLIAVATAESFHPDVATSQIGAHGSIGGVMDIEKASTAGASRIVRREGVEAASSSTEDDAMDAEEATTEGFVEVENERPQPIEDTEEDRKFGEDCAKSYEIVTSLGFEFQVDEVVNSMSHEELTAMEEDVRNKYRSGKPYDLAHDMQQWYDDIEREKSLAQKFNRPSHHLEKPLPISTLILASFCRTANAEAKEQLGCEARKLKEEKLDLVGALFALGAERAKEKGDDYASILLKRKEKESRLLAAHGLTHETPVMRAEAETGLVKQRKEAGYGLPEAQGVRLEKVGEMLDNKVKGDNL